jgi:hypothetical protein
MRELQDFNDIQDFERHYQDFRTTIDRFGSFLIPPWQSFNPGNVLTGANNTSYLWYLGRALKKFSNIQIGFRVTTAIVGGTFAEIGLFTGEFGAFNANKTCYKYNFVDVLSSLGSTGNKFVNLGGFEVKEGEDLWLGFCQGFSTSGAGLRASEPDELNCGFFGEAVGRISSNASFLISLSGLNPPWMPIRVIR